MVCSCSFFSTASGVDTRRLGHSVAPPKKKSHPDVTRFHKSSVSQKKKTTRLRRSLVDDPTLPGSRGTSLTDCRTTAVLTASVCTRNHDRDAEPNCFSSMFLLGMSWCSDCDAAFQSLRGGVRKNVIQTNTSFAKWSKHQQKILLFDNSRTTSSRRKAQVEVPTLLGSTKLHWRCTAYVNATQGHAQEFLGIDHVASAHLMPYASTLGP